MNDPYLKERIAVAKRDGVRVGSVEVDDYTFGGDPVFFVNGQYAGYLQDVPGTPECDEMMRALSASDENDGY